MEHTHKITAGQGWGAVSAYRGNLDELVVTCERDTLIARVEEVITTCWAEKSEAMLVI